MTDGLTVTGGAELVETDGDRYTLAVDPANVDVLAVGIPGPPGLVSGQGEGYQVPAAVPVGGHRGVLRTAAGVAYADAATAGHAGRAVGVSLNAAAAGDLVTVLAYGPVTEPTWSWNPALPVFLGANGVLTQTPPVAPAAAFALTVGYPLDAHTLFVDPQEAVLL